MTTRPAPENASAPAEAPTLEIEALALYDAVARGAHEALRAARMPREENT